MSVAAAVGPVVHTIHLKPSWWTGPAAPGRNILRTLIASVRSAWCVLAAVIAVQAAHVAVTPAVVALAGTAVTVMVAVLAWQWDPTTGIDMADRAEAVALWCQITGRRAGITGTVEHAVQVIAEWAEQVTVINTTGGAW